MIQLESDSLNINCVNVTVYGVLVAQLVEDATRNTKDLFQFGSQKTHALDKSVYQKCKTEILVF